MSNIAYLTPGNTHEYRSRLEEIRRVAPHDFEKQRLLMAAFLHKHRQAARNASELMWVDALQRAIQEGGHL